tara:strand:+ start:3416 stop:5284 length:1869 start_codon:yes stop_codon:yes gene_type:complete
MKNIITFSFLIASALSLVSFNSYSQTIFEIIESSDVHNTLEAAIVAAELDGTLASEGPFTVFAPTDDAFSVVPADVLETLLADPTGQLTQILLNHVVSGTAMSTDLADGMMITTLQGTEVLVSINDGVVMIGNAMVVSADIAADNGVVHVIDAILMPDMPTNSIFDIVANSDIHNTLEAAIVAAGLEGTLSSDGPFTLFAPTDEAFSVVPADVLETLLADPTGQLTQILLNHVVSGTAMSTDLADGMMITTLQGTEVLVSINDGVVMIGNAMVVAADIAADNGVVHVIDAILMPEMPTNTVFDIVANSDVHNTLEVAIMAAGLAETLSSDGPFTVFAPTDNAFSVVPAEVIETLLADPAGMLTQILLNHVVAGTTMSTDLADGMMITTLQGTEVLVSINDGVVMIGNAMVVAADISADNGVVHVIDAILMPEMPTNTVFDIIANSDVHNTLEAAIVAAGLDETLSSEGSFTVFAPTDEAFSVIPADVLETLLADPTGQLTQILLSHVASGTTMSIDLSDGMMITTLQGAEVLVSINDGVVMIGNAMVVLADITADNGVVHVINAVIDTSVNNIFESTIGMQNDTYLYSIDITGREINVNITNQIVFDVYKSGRTIKRFVSQQ